MASSEFSCDVLIVGAGPVGMTAAVLLASRGVHVTVLEKNLSTANDPKAISLDDESLRVYQGAGIHREVLEVIVPGTGTMYFDADNEPLFHARASVPFRSGFPFKNPFAQPDLERVLCDVLTENPLVDLRFGTEFVGVAQDRDGITTFAESPDGHLTIRSKFVLGADGGRSPLRTLLGVTMSGTSHDDVWLVIDCLGDTRTERYGMHHGDPRRPHVIVPGLSGRCRYEFYVYPGECEATAEPPFELIERLLFSYRPITPEQVERAVAYKFHGLNADRWRVDRAFLLGDAAHMMPPFAGQGLNSGIRDAANLTWKLSEVLHKGAADGLLDTYEVERRPHAEAVIRSSEMLGDVVMTRDETKAKSRDACVRRAMGTVEGRRYLEEMQYRPTSRCIDGLVIEPDGHPLIGVQIGQPTVFDFTTHRQIPFDLLSGNGWCVVGVGLDSTIGGKFWEQAMSALDFFDPTFVDVPLDDHMHERSTPIQVAIDLDQRLYAEFSAARGQFVILRPDHFVAAVVSPENLRSVARDLRERYVPNAARVEAQH